MNESAINVYVGSVAFLSPCNASNSKTKVASCSVYQIDMFIQMKQVTSLAHGLDAHLMLYILLAYSACFISR